MQRSAPGRLFARLLRGGGWRSVISDESLLRRRTTLYAKYLFLFVGAFYVFCGGACLVEGMGHTCFEASAMAHLSLTFALFSLWLYLRRATVSARAAQYIESLGTLVVCSAYAFMMWTLPSSIPDQGLVYGMALTLVTRAAIIPSPPLRTAGVGIVSVALMALAVKVRGESIGVMAAWGVAFTLATSILSRTIYGLRNQVREALKLGQYILEKKLGEGGMGVVYLAKHAMLRRPTAIKLLRPEKAGESNIARFEREVQHTSRLAHPNTVAIYDYGRTPSGIFYYAMEYLDGLDLDTLIRTHGRQPPERVIHILSQVASALAEAHQMGLVHRDIKPANILLCDRGGVPDTVKVVDFGLVKDLAESSHEPKLTAHNAMAGTPMFMAPECMLAPDQVDGRTDLYALGAVGYFLLTGQHVFEGATPIAICTQHLHATPDRPSSRTSAPLPSDLEALILSCLAKKKQDRPSSATQLLESLLRCDAARNWTRSEAHDWWTRHRSISADFDGPAKPAPPPPRGHHVDAFSSHAKMSSPPLHPTSRTLPALA